MLTKILLDTNILIQREDNEILSESLQSLLKLMNNNHFKIYIHPLSFRDIEKDKNNKRRKITLSKLNVYPQLIKPPKFDDDKYFKNRIKYIKTNDYIDNSLLYSLYKKEVNYLITEDLGIHKTAKKFNIDEQVLTIDEALTSLNIKIPFKPPTIKQTTVNTLDINDPIFNTLKEDYKEFNDWFDKICKRERECLTYTERGKLGALIIYKIENEVLTLTTDVIPPKKRIKISTMKVSKTGNKIGEFFISWIVNYAINLKCEEIYLTHFTKPNDSLVYLIEEYGFKYVGCNTRGEEIFIKNINKKVIQTDIINSNDTQLEIAKNHYPYFCDDITVRKFIVPIKPKYHKKLFLKNETQSILDTYIDNGFEEYPKDLLAVNPIKKAYLSHSNIHLQEGDLLLFYESNKKGISDIGIVESANKVDKLENLLELISKRSVYSLDELNKMLEKEILAILFIHCKTYDNKVSYDELISESIISKGSLQSIQKLSHEKYLILKEKLKLIKK